MSEEQLTKVTHEIEMTIRMALFDRGMTQRELAVMIGENAGQVNKAIKGDISPKARRIRQEIAKVLNI